MRLVKNRRWIVELINFAFLLFHWYDHFESDPFYIASEWWWEWVDKTGKKIENK